MPPQTSNEAQDFLNELGDVIGVSELTFNNYDALSKSSKIADCDLDGHPEAVNAPVLIAENAFVFLAW